MIPMTSPRLVLPVLLAMLPISSLFGYEIVKNDGTVYNSPMISRSGDQLKVKISSDTGGSIEVGIPINALSKVSFPEPPVLAKVAAAADAGKAGEVILLSEDFVAKEGEFKDVPGSWWPDMATYRLLALVGIGKNQEASDLARSMGAIKEPSMELLSRAGTLFGPLASGDKEAVVMGAKALPRMGGEQGSALAQLALGQALLDKKDYAGALRAFLTIKIFYPSSTLLQPAALYGAANAYAGLKDKKHAIEALKDLIATYPSFPKTPDAKKMAAGLERG
jgi:tetratricopeptide (TPR) repeat protein